MSDQKRLDGPDREKIARELFKSYHPHPFGMKSDWEEFYEKADQILALIPDIEGLKAQIKDDIQLVIELRNALAQKDVEIEETKKQERIETGVYLEHCYLSHCETHRLISIHDIERLKRGQALKQDK